MKETKELEWMPIYWDKFLSATTHFDASEIGAYMLLIAHQWKHGYIVNDLKIVKKIARLPSAAKISHVLSKFNEINGKLVNEVCDLIRKEQLIKWENTSKRNQENVKKRYQKATTGSTTGSTTGTQNKRIIDNKINSNKLELNNFNDFKIDFGEIKLYPLSEIQDILLADEIWIEFAAKYLGKDFDFVRKKIPEFMQYLSSCGVTEKSLKESKTHFTNKYGKQGNTIGKSESIADEKAGRIPIDKIKEFMSKRGKPNATATENS
jgi:uncharacterized protein YdaU (DUF1376 family)